MEENARFRRGPPKTLDEAVAGLEIQSVTIPVTADITRLRSGVFDVGQYASWGLSNNGSKSVKGLLVRGFSFEPDVREGDVIFVDTETKPAAGNIVLCYHDEELRLVRYLGRTARGATAESDVQVYGTVIGINRRLA